MIKILAFRSKVPGRLMQLIVVNQFINNLFHIFQVFFHLQLFLISPYHLCKTRYNCVNFVFIVAVAQLEKKIAQLDKSNIVF